VFDVILQVDLINYPFNLYLSITIFIYLNLFNQMDKMFEIKELFIEVVNYLYNIPYIYDTDENT
jgi:hypothetical protein